MVLVTAGWGQGAEWREGSELDHLLPRHPSPPLNAGGRAYPTLPSALPSQSRMSLNHGAASHLGGPEAALEGHRHCVHCRSILHPPRRACCRNQDGKKGQKEAEGADLGTGAGCWRLLPQEPGRSWFFLLPPGPALPPPLPSLVPFYKHLLSIFHVHGSVLGTQKLPKGLARQVSGQTS